VNEVLDKMRFISRKELAKHRALSKNNNFQKFQLMDLRNENEISIEDIASDDDKYKEDKFEDFKNASEGDEDDEDLKNIDNLYEFWHENDKKKMETMKEKNPNIDARLEEYLRSHSQQLSLHV
jgi:hypothetical protein